MIKIHFSFDDGSFHFDIKDCFYFSQLVQYFKQKYIKYNPLSKTYPVYDAILANALYLDLQAYDTIDISKEDVQLLEDLIYPKDSKFKKIKLNLDKEFFTLHPPLKGKPPYENFQVDAIRKGLCQNKILYDISVRHGKTYIVCGVIHNLIKNKMIDKIFIICRPEGVENFKVEILRFLGHLFTEDDIGIITTQNREIEDYFNKKILITNYITFRLSCEYYNNLTKSTAKKPKKKTIDFSNWKGKKILITDEGQSLNNYDSLQSHFIHLYKDEFDNIIDMSGSIGFNVLHLYSHAKLLIPESIPYCFSSWTDYIAEKGTGYSKSAIRELRPEKVKEFKEKVLDTVQVSYRDCIQETTMHEKEIFIKMSDKMKEIYRSFIDKEINARIYKQKHELSTQNLKNMFGRLSLVTSDISLLDEEFSKKWKFTDNPKLDILSSLLDKYINEENRKVVLWGSHPKVLENLSKYFKKYNPITIHGQSEIEKEERVAYVNKFNSDNDCKLLICNYVLATSITIKATKNIYFDIPVNSDNFMQSKKRIHGPMQKEEVESIYLLFNNSIDIYIYYNILQDRLAKKNILSNKEEVDLQVYKEIFSAKAESYLQYTGD